MGDSDEQPGGRWRPTASSDAVQARMARQRRRDTKAEIQVRKCLHAMGIRFRVDTKLEPDLRTRGDVVWKGLKLVVFIDGCFWHGCPEHATRPKANAEWWASKLDGNIARDRRTDAILAERGWTVRRFWEHQAPAEVAETVLMVLTELRRKRMRKRGSGEK